jgi:cell division protease FtsH
MWLPTEDRTFETKGHMKDTIMHMLGGRVAEALTLDDISTGASNDIQRATEIARDMVTKYGFSENIGPVNYSDSDEVFLGKDFSTKKNFSDGVASKIDEEVRTIMEEGYKGAEKILKENMDKLETVAQALLRVETLDGEQFEALYTGAIDAEGLEQQVKEKEEEIKKANAKEAEEFEKIRKEEEEKLAADLARYDTDYLEEDEKPEDTSKKETVEGTESGERVEATGEDQQESTKAEPEAQPEETSASSEDDKDPKEEN